MAIVQQEIFGGKVVPAQPAQIVFTRAMASGTLTEIETWLTETNPFLLKFYLNGNLLGTTDFGSPYLYQTALGIVRVLNLNSAVSRGDKLIVTALRLSEATSNIFTFNFRIS